MNSSHPPAPLAPLVDLTAVAGGIDLDALRSRFPAPAAGQDTKKPVPVHTAPAVPKSRNRKPGHHTMLSDLAHKNIDEVFTIAQEYWTNTSIYPGNIDDLQDPLDEIRAWSRNNNRTTMADLGTQSVRQLLCDLTNTTDLKSVTAPDEVDRLHLLRNLIIALRGAALLSAPANAFRRTDRPANDSLAAALPDLPRRSATKKRPLTDDEVLLTRTLVEIDLHEQGDPQAAIAYLLAESGIRTTPSTCLTTDDLDDRDTPTCAQVRHVWNSIRAIPIHERPGATRTVTFEPYVAHALARALIRLRPGNTPLSYRGAQPGTRAACASVDAMLPHFIRRAGINCYAYGEVTPLSIVLWRPYRLIIQDQDWVGAREVHGGCTKNLSNDLKLKSDEEDAAFGLIHLTSLATGERLATVPRAGFADRY